ncbi:MAG: hypothetical protein D8M59_16910 [Planctomycetes bacterium]|nr:hypothetical protein [Planctomycetota bacterium]NOG52858.1 hypothetical protein [Planctomycetota bacterium]
MMSHSDLLMKTEMAMPRTLKQACEVQSNGLHDKNDIPGMPLPVLKAAGIDLMDHWKEGLTAPGQVSNLLALRDPSLHRLSADSIGALCTLSAIADSTAVRKSAPVIAQAAESTATPQIRNVATAGGNLFQRPRCWYYRAHQFDCLKKGGHMCFAVEGENRYHAVFGNGPCHIVHPSNLANALSVCQAEVLVVSSAQGTEEPRRVPMHQLFCLPEDRLKSEHTLGPDEIAVGISYRAAPHSAHYEVREKQSFDWPLVMASVALDMRDDGRTIAAARVCAGGVAPIPWRMPQVERALAGINVKDTQRVRQACDLAIRGAQPMSNNAYKLRILPVAVSRAVRLAVG